MRLVHWYIFLEGEILSNSRPQSGIYVYASELSLDMPAVDDRLGETHGLTLLRDENRTELFSDIR